MLCSLCLHRMPLQPEAMPEVILHVLSWSRAKTTCSSSHLKSEFITGALVGRGTN